MKKILSLCLIAACAAIAAPRVGAADKKPAPAEAGKAAKGKSLPFTGILTAVDKQAKTITVGERVFQVTSETKITKAGKPATLEDGVVGEEAAGSCKTADGGKMEAGSVRFGAKAAKPKTP
ncbi:MAG: hypothetical protein EXS33_05070 [Pedosphaera sp.]|nr:hypothetical protein [Pedosphaera sp.]